ncbi:MAG TPA: ferredoxin [Nevskiaceae bacterium]|nr:ferredoxin [Nevskiaceae bacterium]
MKICIDYAKCQGHTMCHLTSPRLIDVGAEDGRGIVRFEDVPPELEDDALRARDSCPEEAIQIA